jgi:P27 family predicted phage terminase small subunit
MPGPPPEHPHLLAQGQPWKAPTAQATTLDLGPFSAYCCAYARWQQAEEALQRSGELTIKTAEGHPRVKRLVRIASQAMDDMRRIGAEFGLSPNARLRLSGINPAPSPSKFDGLLK